MRTVDGVDGVDDVDQLLDLRSAPLGDYWNRIMAAVRKLDGEPGARPPTWRLKVLVGDTPEAAVELPHLIAHLERLDIRHELTREADGGQRLLLARSS